MKVILFCTLLFFAGCTSTEYFVLDNRIDQLNTRLDSLSKAVKKMNNQQPFGF